MDNLIGEFIGTAVLVTFGCGVNANVSLKKTNGSGGGWICVTAGFRLSLLYWLYLQQ